MLKARKLQLNGLELDGSKPVTPRTQQFLAQHEMKVKLEGGFVELTSTKSGAGISMGQKFSQDVAEFNNDKDRYIKKHNL